MVLCIKKFKLVFVGGMVVGRVIFYFIVKVMYKFLIRGMFCSCFFNDDLDVYLIGGDVI